jgi:hypothetical protein
MKLTRLYPHITEEQNILIRRGDYGALLDIKCSKLHLGLYQFLINSFDAATCKMEFPGHGSIPVTEESVHLVIGVPMGRLPVIYK